MAGGNTLLADLREGKATGSPSENTVARYMRALKGLFVIEGLGGVKPPFALTASFTCRAKTPLHRPLAGCCRAEALATEID
jgi:hypothetical protein